MLTVAELRAVSAARLDDAQSLFNAERYDGVVYLCGYAVELALKARICETLNWGRLSRNQPRVPRLSVFPNPRPESAAPPQRTRKQNHPVYDQYLAGSESMEP